MTALVSAQPLIIPTIDSGLHRPHTSEATAPEQARGARAYKVLGKDGRPYHGGTGAWILLTRNHDGSWTPGDWMPEIAEVTPCRAGYHYCVGEIELLHWLGPTIYAIEPGPSAERHETIHVTNTARLLYPIKTWNERTARLFAADCAEHVIHLFEQEYPDAPGLRLAIEAARAGHRGAVFSAEAVGGLDPQFDAALAACAAAALLDAMPGTFHSMVTAVTFAARVAAWVAAWMAIPDVSPDDVEPSREHKHEVRRAGRAGRRAEQQWQAERLRAYLEGAVV